MNSLGITAVWGIAQVSAVTLFALACYAIVRRRGPAARSQVVATSLAVTLLVAALAISPWPRWFSVSPNNDVVSTAPQIASVDFGQQSVAQNAEANSGEGADATGVQQASPNTGDVAAAFWKTLLRELDEAPAATGAKRGFSWPIVVAAALALALVLGALRLIVGLWGVRQLRADSRPVADRPLLDEVERLRQAMGCSKSVEIRASSRLASPVTVGWRRALIILPGDWDSWNDAELRTALAHELAHVKRGDYAAALLAQLCVAANYYHPVVHWLAGRLRLEQELAADAAAATVIGSRGEYLMTLAQLALRCDDRPIAWAARPFLPAQGALSRRIDMLRDARQVLTRPMSGGLRAMIVVALVGAGIFAAGVRGPGGRAGTALAAPPGTITFTGTNVIGKKAPFDLSQIPRDSYFILAARPWQVLTQQGLEPFAKLINEAGFKERFGDSVENVDEVIIAGKFEAIVKRKVPGVAPDAPAAPKIRVVMRMKSPIDEAKLPVRIAALGPAKSEEVGGKKLYLADGVNDFGYFFPDPSTIVMGETEALRAWLKSGEKTNWTPTGWDDVATTDTALWFDVKAIRPMLTDAKNMLEMQMLSPFAVVWEETDHLVAGATLDDKLRIRATAHCTSPENAERVQKTLEAAITLATNSAGALEAGPQPGPAAAQLTLFALTGIKLAAEAKVTRSDSKVVITVDAPLESLLALASVPPAVSAARDAARRAQSANNMKQLGIAMHNYADAHKHFPPALGLGPDGKTPHSWRVALLPFLGPEGKKLFDEYKLNQPWDSEDNKKVLAKMPAVFRCPQDDPKSLNSSYFAVVGPQTIFHDDKGTRLQQITDGLSNTILFVEAKRDVPWTKPEDIEVPPDKPLPKFGGWFGNAVLVAIADGSVHVWENLIPDKAMRELLTMAGGEPLDASSFDRAK